jgi:hypothetical protein
MRIDTSGNLLVGKTSNDYSTEGAIIRPDGDTLLTRNGTPLTIRRNTTTGELIDLRKDGTTVGTIGVNSVYTFIGTPSVNTLIKFDNSAIHPVNSVGNTRDNAIDLGNSAARFKNLYLSGGAYIGGTGSANYLDDYEEGTYEPTFTGSSAGTLTLQTSYRTLAYTKIGRQVTITGRIRNAASGTISGALQISLPFAIASLTQEADIFSGSVLVRDLDVPTNTFDLNVLGEGGTSVIEVYASIDNGVWHDIDAGDSPQNAYYVFGFSYFTDS